MLQRRRPTSHSPDHSPARPTLLLELLQVLQLLLQQMLLLQQLLLLVAAAAAAAANAQAAAATAAAARGPGSIGPAATLARAPAAPGAS